MGATKTDNDAVLSRPKPTIISKTAIRTSATLAIASLAIGATSSFWMCPCARRTAGLWITGAWALLPPVFFWWEWEFSDRFKTDKQAEFIKHSHDLSRNLWIAFVVVLAALFGIEPFKI